MNRSSRPAKGASRWAAWLVVSVGAWLAGCGGAASDAGSPSGPTAAGQIRFAARYEAGCSGCTPSRRPSLTIAPIVGASTLGSRDIARVEVRVDEGTAQVLTATNGADGAGRAVYRFDLPAPAPQPILSVNRTCSPEQSLQITVTDVAGFAFTKYHGACHDADFGGFSDYGNRTVAFTIDAPAGGSSQLMRMSAADAGYVDTVIRNVVSGTTWSVPAAEGDFLQAFGGDLQALPAGTPLSVSIAAPGGGSATTTVLALATGTDAGAFLKCCTGSSSPAGTPRDLALVAYTARYGEPADNTSHRFSVRYTLTDPATGIASAELNGTATGYSSWPMRAMPGQVLSVEATPQQAGTYVYLSIADTAGGGTGDAFGSERSMGMAHSNRIDAPARLKVICCAPSRSAISAAKSPAP